MRNNPTLHKSWKHSEMDKFFDKYVWQARVWPGFLTFLPLVMAFFAWDPKIEDAAKPYVSAAVGAGIIALLASVARSAGKKAETCLVKKWGALPTTVLLRHSDPTLDQGTKRRYHTAMTKLVPTIKAPSQDQEATDPGAADGVYQAWTRHLIARTREKTKFNLVFAENMEYGFRRNLFGLRPLGIAVSTASAAACGWKTWVNRQTGALDLDLAMLAFCAAMVVVWLCVINGDWVLQGGKAYALRLLEAINLLQEQINRGV